ncbi:UNVERIFIED_CONTAM: hypothetical protein GTU68_011016 [Idotea baltica]|nr:hypothetical protein [Idotea baltica]
MAKTTPFSKAEIEAIAETHPTPFHIYDEAAIRANARTLKEAFAWADFKEYFAVKATPNPVLLKILHEEGFGGDCSSVAELELCDIAGLKGEEIMFTSNDTPANEYKRAVELGAVVNLDDISHISYLEECAGLPELLSFRYNPGSARRGNAIIGTPEDAKFGLTKAQIFEAYKIAKEKGVKRFGLHTMVISNELNQDYFVETAEMLFELVAELKAEGIDIESVNLGGGIGIPAKPEEKAVDLLSLGQAVKVSYERMIEATGLAPLKIFLECGRMVTGPYGYLVSRVRHKKNIYKEYVGLEATMADLMRPGMYGAYHHISVLGKENAPETHKYDVTGSLCENNDKFAVDRMLPEIAIGDIVVIHDTGAHGHSMGFNYNGKLRSAELLFREDRSALQIRRAETLEDLFATLDFSQVKDLKRKVA